ncbi:Uncharacterized protein TCM_032492 [Theobroma cacao]|uniref:Uncharacterized protein n=1 Tax=Theobroma cacao TaxID=3641 RepID=A0A061FAB3_THECC|nr:Uncharacterized protein TCM_032492 [Theobroma cacao]
MEIAANWFSVSKGLISTPWECLAPLFSLLSFSIRCKFFSLFRKSTVFLPLTPVHCLTDDCSFFSQIALFYVPWGRVQLLRCYVWDILIPCILGDFWGYLRDFAKH